jgi:KDO2-lipid IV(A) lauroyltransferase
MKIRNAILTAVIFIIAILPFPVIYLLSDFLAFFIRDVIRYRRDVIMTNLSRSFPEKSEAEIKSIARKFYRNLADLIMETIKSSRMTRKQVEDRVKFLNQEIFGELYNEKRSVFAALGHCGNWEWVGNKIAAFLQHDGGAIYKPVHDKFFDDYMIGLRQKYKGTLMIDYKKVFRTLVSLKDKLFTVFVLADQSPPRTEMYYYVEFLGQQTAFFEGMEKVARALNYTVIYLDVKRVKRGYYQVDVKTITKESRDTAPGFINRSYVRLLEESIRNQPDNWLWSHRRWKKREEKPN